VRQAAHTSQQPWLLQPRATVASPGEACSITRDSSRVGRPGLSPGWSFPFGFGAALHSLPFPSPTLPACCNLSSHFCTISCSWPATCANTAATPAQLAGAACMPS
jgi:hypothetical protein